MVHRIQIDDSTPMGKQLLNELRRHPQAVKFENPIDIEEVPEGYTTGKEFWKEVRTDLKKLYRGNEYLFLCNKIL